jgi:hypothetical protein
MKVCWCVAPSIIRVSLVNCSSNFILFATSEGSPLTSEGIQRAGGGGVLDYVPTPLGKKSGK